MQFFLLAVIFAIVIFVLMPDGKEADTIAKKDLLKDYVVYVFPLRNDVDDVWERKQLGVTDTEEQCRERARIWLFKHGIEFQARNYACIER